MNPPHFWAVLGCSRVVLVVWHWSSLYLCRAAAGLSPSMRAILHVRNAQPTIPAAEGHLPPWSRLQPPLAEFSHLLRPVTCLSLKPGIFGLKTDLESDKI